MANAFDQFDTPLQKGNPFDQFDAPRQKAPPRQRTAGEETARQLGLGGRSIVEGLTGLAALPSDALFGLVNYIQAKRGEPMPFKLASQSISEGLTRAGAPEPESGTERFAGAVQSALSGVGGQIGVGRQLMAQAIPRIETAAGPAILSAQRPAMAASAARSGDPLALAASAPRGPLPETVGELLATAPAAQTAGTVGGVTASQTAAALGAPLPVQLAAGLAGGTVAGAPASVSGATRRGVSGLAEPLTEPGRQAIAGRILNEAASDAAVATRTLEQQAASRAQPGQLLPDVPGSAPTTGQAARDTGLAYFEERLRALGDPRFQQRSSQQNEARQVLLDSVANGGLPQRIKERIAMRDQVTAGLRERAYQEAAGKKVRTETVIADIDRLLANPENAGVSVQRALQSVRGQLFREGTRVQAGGKKVPEMVPLRDARALYAVRKEINRVLEGKYIDADESVLRYAGGQLSEVRRSIDNAIESVAPSWRGYLTKYAQLSKPIERAETMGAIREKTGLAAPDLRTGRDFISQAKWKTQVTQAMPELRTLMTRGQLQKLERITQDLDAGAAAAAAGKMRGSDTAANLAMSGRISVANVVSRVMGTRPEQLSPGWASFSKPLSFLYSIPDESIRNLLVEAMLDPRLAEQLLKAGTPENVERFVTEFARSTQAAATGATASQVAQ